MTPIPAACNSAMTPAHIDPSANAPCTSSTVGMLPFRNGPDGLIEGCRIADKAPHER